MVIAMLCYDVHPLGGLYFAATIFVRTENSLYVSVFVKQW